MNGLPYYKAYPRDFIEGTIGMPFEIKCAYRVVLDLIYMQGGNLPDDARYISGLLGCSIRKWKTIRETLIEMDKLQVSGEFLTNYRAEKELETLAKLQDVQRENASRPRKNKGLQKPRQRQPEPEPEPELDTSVSNRRASALDCLSEVVDSDLAADFIAHRKAIRKPMTPQAGKLMASKIEKWEPPEREASLRRSIENGWTGVFEPAPNIAPFPSRRENNAQRTDDAFDALAEKLARQQFGD